jgi:alkaline phosphatase
MYGEIFSQVLAPRAGDGVDVLIGSGRKEVLEATRKLGVDVLAGLKRKGFDVYDCPEAVTGKERRVVALFDNPDYDFAKAVERATAILSRNPRGFFLMAEWDTHTDNPKTGLDRVLVLDGAIRQTAGHANDDTLILFAADHSFDFRIRGGKKGAPLFPGPGSPEAARKPPYRVEDGHTGEEVLVAAQGPGAERVHGYFANTDLFHIMMAAYGWEQ